MAIQDLTASLDLKQNLNIYATCKQGDNLNLILSIFDNSLQVDLSNYNVRLRAMKADKVPLIQEHIGITISGNVVNIEADEQLTTTAGKTPIELQFIDKTTGKKKATFNLVLIVVPSTIEVNASISTATYTLLEELENKLDQASDFFENIDEAIEANTDLIASTNTANSSKTALDGSNTTALATKSALDTSNTNATNIKNALNTSIDNANTSKTALDTSKTNADTSKVALDASIVDSEKFVAEHQDVNNLIATVANNTASLSDIAVNIRTFGGHSAEEIGYENFDNHDSIINAINYAVTNKISRIIFPSGTIKTSPLDLRQYKSITLDGNSSGFGLDGATVYDKNITTLQIINNGDIGIQCSDTTNPAIWKAQGSITIKNIRLNCDKKVRCGINCNYDVTLENIMVMNAIEDGITLEDLSYPVHLHNVYSEFNGKNGVYVKAPMTTCYSMRGCEFSNNDGYGLYIEGGAYCNFDNLILQGNKIGGLKIKKLSLIYTGDYSLNNLTFNNLYTEGNGILEVSDAKYEGNYSVIITSDILDNNTGHKAKFITFNGGFIGKSATGKVMKVDTIYGLNFDKTSIYLPDIIIPTPQWCASIHTSTQPNYVGNGVQNAPYPLIGSYGINDDKTQFLKYNCGIIGNRGRVIMMPFYIGNINAGTTVNMLTTMNGFTPNYIKGYPLFGSCSILGFLLHKISCNANMGGSLGTGSLTAKITMSNNVNTTPSIDKGVPSLTINNIDITQNTEMFEPLAYSISEIDNNWDMKNIGVQITASADYNEPFADNSVWAYVLIEC